MDKTEKMELLGLDASFQPVKTLRCINIQWNRKYYEAGDYQIQLRLSDWNTRIVYIISQIRPEVGMVQKFETEHTEKGDTALVSGLFLEGMLNWKVTYPKHKSTGNVCAACKGLVTSLMADTGVTVPSAANIGTSAAFESEGENLGDATFAALKKQELSQRIKYNYVSDTLYYEVWQGLDRTQDQTYNAFATFSQNYGMIDGMALTLDSSALCNYAVVTYTDPASGNDISMNVDLRSSSSLPKRILYVATGMSKDDDQSTSDFLAAVESEARTQLADYVSTTTLDVKVLQKNLIYRQDYDLGDKCDIQDDRLKLAYKALIIEIAEVWKDNQHSVEITFGDKVKTNYARYLRKRKK